MSVPVNETNTAADDGRVPVETAKQPTETPAPVTVETAPGPSETPAPVTVETAPGPSETIVPEDARSFDESDVQPLPTQSSDTDDLQADEVPDDIKRLLEDPNGPFQLEGGQVVVIRQLKFREFLALLRIITRGASSTMSGMVLNFDDTDSFVQTFFAMMLFAIPEADGDVIRFIQMMVEPAELTGNMAVDDEKRRALQVDLSNPDMEDVVNVLAKVIAAEGADLQALGKRLMNMWKVASKMGVTKGIPTK